MRPPASDTQDHWIDRPWIWACVWPLFFAAPTTINAFSVLSEAAQRGWTVQTWEPFAWEYTSFAASLAGVAPFTLILRHAWSSCAWPRRVIAWAAAAIVYAVLHIGLMVLSRRLLYAALGRRYDFGDWLVQGLYEMRKDFVTCLALGGVVWAVQAARDLRRARARPSPEAPAEPLVYTIGGRVYRTPLDAVSHVRASGHYVEIATTQGVRLVRRSLADLERAAQGSRLVRTHRSWLVNLDHIQRADPKPSGDWDLVLSSGASAPLSRRYRAVLDALRQ